MSYLRVDDRDEFDELGGLEFLASSFDELDGLASSFNELDSLEFLASSFDELNGLDRSTRPHFRWFLGSTRPRFDEFAGLLDLTSTMTSTSSTSSSSSMASILRPRVTSVLIVLRVYLTSV